MKTPETKTQLEKAVKKLSKANEKWFDTERASQIKKFTEKLKNL